MRAYPPPAGADPLLDQSEKAMVTSAALPLRRSTALALSMSEDVRIDIFGNFGFASV